MNGYVIISATIRKGVVAMLIKYIRVSTKHQSTERQEQDLDQYDKVFIDKESGATIERTQFAEMMNYVREGDIVVFESFSRISRSLPDLLRILDVFEKKGVKWRSEKEQIDTSGASGKLIVSILGAISQYEREINRERRTYGFERAKAEGRVGRPKIELTDAQLKVIQKWQGGEITAVEAMKQTGLTKTVFYKKAKELTKKKED